MQEQVMQPLPELEVEEEQQQHKPLEIEEISSPLSTQLLEFCDDELFPETMPGSEVTSCSNCCLDDYNIDSADLFLPQATEEFSNVLQDEHANTIPTTTAPAIFYLLDDMEINISTSTDFSPYPSSSVPPILCTQDQQFELSEMKPLQRPPPRPQFQLSNVVSNALQSNRSDTKTLPPIVVGPHLFPSVYEDECLSSVPSYMAMNPSSPSCSFLSSGAGMRSYIPTSMNSALSSDGSGIYTLMNGDLQPLELDFQADSNGLFCPDSAQVFRSHDLQGFCGESQNIVNGHGDTTPLPSDMSSLEDSMFRVGKLSMEQRKEKIHRYMKKRNERNFSKKIKYACRKTLADSRPRVRGRFAKNAELGENFRHACGNHDEENKGKVVGMVAEDEIIDSSDIFAPSSAATQFIPGYDPRGTATSKYLTSGSLK